jgi:hypothetical protein
LQVENNHADKQANLTLLASNGMVILSKNVAFNRGTNNYQIELDDKLKGVYFIEFIADKKVYRKKIIIL